MLYPSCKEKSRLRPLLCPRPEWVGPGIPGRPDSAMALPLAHGGGHCQRLLTGALAWEAQVGANCSLASGSRASSPASGGRDECAAVTCQGLWSLLFEHLFYLLKPSWGQRGQTWLAAGRLLSPRPAWSPSGSPCRRCRPPGSRVPVPQHPCAQSQGPAPCFRSSHPVALPAVLLCAVRSPAHPGTTPCSPGGEGRRTPLSVSCYFPPALRPHVPPP